MILIILKLNTSLLLLNFFLRQQPMLAFCSGTHLLLYRIVPFHLILVIGKEKRVLLLTWIVIAIVGSREERDSCLTVRDVCDLCSLFCPQMSSVKDRIAALQKKSQSVEISSNDPSVNTSSGPVRRSSLSSTPKPVPVSLSASATTPDSKSNEQQGQSSQLSVKEKASMFKAAPASETTPIRRSSVNDSPSLTPESKKSPESSTTGLSVKERLAKLNAASPSSSDPTRRPSMTTSYSAPSVTSRRPSVTGNSPAATPEKTSATGSAFPTTPESSTADPAVLSVKEKLALFKTQSTEQTMAPPRRPSITATTAATTQITSPEPAPVVAAPAPAATDPVKEAPAPVAESATAESTSAPASSSFSGESATAAGGGAVLSVKERLALMKSNPPPIQTPPSSGSSASHISRRATTNDISGRTPAPLLGTTSSTASPAPAVGGGGPASAPTGIAKRSTVFLEKPSEEKPGPAPSASAGREKRVSKLNPALLGMVNVGALGPGAPRPPFTMPPSVLSGGGNSSTRKRSTSTSETGEMTHVRPIPSLLFLPCLFSHISLPTDHLDSSKD
jgi:hypothetical protein